MDQGRRCAVGVGYPGDRLRHLLPARAVGIRPAAAVAADGQGDDPGPDSGEVLRPESTRRQHAGTVALREHIGPAHEVLQLRRFVRVGEIEEAAALAVAGVAHVLRGLRQVLRGDHQDLRTMLRQRPRRHRPRQDTGEIQRLYPGKRALTRRHRLGRTVGDFFDLNQRPAGEVLPLRMREPLVVSPHFSATRVGLGDRVLEVVGVPFGDAVAHAFGRVLALEHPQHARAQLRQVEVWQEPATVLGRPGLGAFSHALHHRVERRRFVAAVGFPEVGEVGRAHGRGRVAGIDRDLLAPPGLRRPQVVDHHPDARDHRRRRVADAEHGRVDRVAAGDGDFASRRQRAAAQGHEFVERVCFDSGFHWSTFRGRADDSARPPPVPVSVPACGGCAPRACAAAGRSRTRRCRSRSSRSSRWRC